MKQMTFAGAKGFEVHGRATRKAEFLARMDALVPWAEFCGLIEPHYPRAGNGRPPLGVERMLRMYLLANWFNLSDEACEDALYDMLAFRDFCRIDLGRERAPDATTLLRFRHLLEEQQIGAALFSKVGELLLAQGMKLSGGTTLATAVCCSRRNSTRARAPFGNIALPATSSWISSAVRKKMSSASPSRPSATRRLPISRTIRRRRL